MIDTITTLKTIVQPNMKFIALVAFVVILAMRYLDSNVLQILFLLAFAFLNHKDFLGIIEDIQHSEKKVERVIEYNRRKKKEVHFNEDLDHLLHKLRKYRKYNPHSYDEGYRYIKMYMYIIHDLEKDDIAHPRQYFENAQLYLKKALNYFQAISVSVPEENLIHALKYNKYEQTKLGNRIGKLCKKIYKLGYHLLYNLSLRLNEDFFENPDMYKTEINLNADQVEESNTFSEQWELY